VYLKIGVEDHDFLGADEEVDLGEGLTLAFGSLFRKMRYKIFN